MLPILEPILSDFREGTVGWMIQRRIEESRQPGSRQLGLSHEYTFRALQKAPIAAKPYTMLKALDFIEHCKARRAGGALPQTVMSDMSALSGLFTHGVDVWDYQDVGLLACRKARRQALKQQLIANSPLRDRLPTEDEIALLRADFIECNKNPRTKIDVELVMDAELLTGRRISELCRIERQHVNVAERTCMLYNLKNSRGKGFHGEFALIEGAWELFERRLQEIPDRPDARLFPFLPKSCGIRYTLAKKKLRAAHPGMFENLRMHDNRAHCFVRLLDLGYSLSQVQKGISLHHDGKTLSQRYVRIKAQDLHRGPTGTPAAQVAR